MISVLGQRFDFSVYVYLFTVVVCIFGLGLGLGLGCVRVRVDVLMLPGVFVCWIVFLEVHSHTIRSTSDSMMIKSNK